MKKSTEKNTTLTLVPRTSATSTSPVATTQLIGNPIPSSQLIGHPTPASDLIGHPVPTPASDLIGHPASTPTLEPPFDAVNCPVRQVLDRFGDKWSILVIILLGDRGKLRFNELSNAIGDISQKMLTVTLRSLEADGLVTRKMYPEIPPRVEYDLTGLAKSLLPLIKEMVKWADANIEEIQENRRRHAERSPAKS
jgi:DNA-binding HxlR family transcriptional regulator